jgi:putative sterol carrier protein
MEETPIAQLVQKAPQALLADKATGINAVVHLHLTGSQAEDWTMTIKDRQCQVERGVPSKPTLTLTAEAQDCLDIFRGKMDGMRAFMQGKLLISGDYMLATRLPGLFGFS